MSDSAKILVVDDNPVVLASLAELLKAAGYSVLEAATGEGCLRLALEHAPDLVLLDVMLPDANGVELCRRMKSRPELGHPFLVLFSASEISSSDMVTGLDAGADGYIARPIQNRELLARVQAMLRIQRTRAVLRMAHQVLENRIQERTSELSGAIQALMTEIEERIKAEASLGRLAERLKIVHTIDQAILAAKSPRDIAAAALTPLQQLVPYEHASVVELDAESGQAEILAAFGPDGQVIGGGWPVAAELHRSSRALRSGEPLIVATAPNLFRAPRRGETEPPKIWCSIIDLPMATEGMLLGVLNLATNRPGAFTAEHQEIAQEIAGKLAVTLRQARLFEQVSDGRRRLREMSQRLVEVQEAERRYIARELHDEIGQVLTGTRMVLDLAANQSSEIQRPRLEEALALLDELTARVRKLSLDLRPQLLDDLGLLVALNWHFQRYSKQTNIRVEFKHTPLPERLPARIETAIFRIAQETLTNVARHAGVKEVTVRLWTDHERAGVQVEDHGGGFDAERALSVRASTGLAGMKERAELLDGEFTLESAKGSGTRVTVELPLAAPTESSFSKTKELR